MDLRYKILCVGSGGTGTYFLKEFSRYLQSYYGRNIFDMSIFDGDIVEEKNLMRQAFMSDDIGMNKAVVMADILNSSFGTKWEAYATYLTELEQLSEFKAYSTADKETVILPLVIGCVDNHACRLLLEEFFATQDNIIYLDSANEFTTGEVVFAVKMNGKLVSPVRSYYFPDIKEADLRKRTEISCEELNDAAPQHIATNMAAGNILLREACSILETGKFHPGMVTFDLEYFTQDYMPYIAFSGKECAA